MCTTTASDSSYAGLRFHDGGPRARISWDWRWGDGDEVDDVRGLEDSDGALDHLNQSFDPKVSGMCAWPLLCPTCIRSGILSRLIGIQRLLDVSIP
jgi:hypothetical protein